VTRTRQRGSAMLVTMIILAALLAGVTVLVSMQLSSTRSSDLTRTGAAGTYCAEAGLAAARPIVAANYSQWGAAIAAPTTEPTWLSTGIGSHDIDGDGDVDFKVTLKDNDDELPPTANNTAVDSDLKIFIVSTCLKYKDSVKQVEELVQYTGGGTCYQSQAGGCGGNNNGN
jgi:Tfp pilus assembly protein PilV